MEANEIRLEAQDLNGQAVALIKAKKLEEAREKLDKAIEIDPMLMDSYKNYGDLYMALDEYENAKNSYKKAMLIGKQPKLHFLYGNACFMNDEPHEGLEQYNMAISEGYDSEEMMFFMGMAYEYLHDDKLALRYFQKACIKNPSRPDYAVKKINTEIKLGMMDEAMKDTEALIRVSPELYDGYHIKTRILLQMGKNDEAVSSAKYASEKFPEDPELMYDYAQAVAFSGKADEAIILIESAKKMKYFSEAESRFTLLEGQIYAEKGDFDEAIGCMEKCVEMESDGGFNAEARFMRMNINLVQLKYNEVLDDAIALANHNAEDSYYYAALYYRAFSTKQLGNVEKANKLYKETNSILRTATLQKPEAIDLYLYRAMCLKDLEEYDKALEMLDFISNLNDGIAEIYVVRAEIYSIQGKSELADEQLRTAYRIKPQLKPAGENSGE